MPQGGALCPWVIPQGFVPPPQPCLLRGPESLGASLGDSGCGVPLLPTPVPRAGTHRSALG